MASNENHNGIDQSSSELMDPRPFFVDNRSGNTLEDALARHLEALAREQALPYELSIATAYFNVPGFNLIEGALDHVGHVRLLLGAEPLPESSRPMRQPGDPDEPKFTERLIEKSLDDLDKGLALGRDLLPFDEPTDAAIRRLLQLLYDKKVEVRRYHRGFLHAKAYIFRTMGGGTIVGSSNLTYSGLRRNRELNLGVYEDTVVSRVEHWFDELWDESEPYDLANLFDRLMAEYDPYLIYMRVLYELYGGELEEEEEETSGEIPITTFQQHGVWRAQKILEKYGGVLICDGVGLGKTFTAGELMRLYREQRQRVLLICPAALRDSTWADFLTKHQLFAECYSYEQLARDRQLGGEGEYLKRPIDEYALVVIDEAHNYRNPDTEARAAVLRRLLMGRRRDVIMLTATPVNNSLWDLYHLLRYFIKQDAIFADKGVLSLRERFKEAMDEDPFDLSPDVLFPIIDATTVKRTRKFIKNNYSNDLIKLPNGQHIPIQFPKPIASSINYSLENVLPGFIDELETALAPEDGEPLLKMARYQPDRYLLEGIEEDEERRYHALVGLIRSGLLKRFESSAHAFALTTERMIREHDLFLDILGRGSVVKKSLLHELSAADDDNLIDELLRTNEDQVPSDLFDVERLRRDVEADRELLAELNRQANTVKPEDDPKLKALIEELLSILRQADDEALDSDDRARKCKVIVFSYFSDTIDWIEPFLIEAVSNEERLSTYRGRIVSVTGNEARGGVSRDEAVQGFAPESMGIHCETEGDDPNRYDIILSTDVLAEGMNLQQCGNIINYDLPWNPMRLVQRHGRIDRINSRHKKVYLRTFFPDAELDRLLKLESRVRRKLARAARSIGVEATPIERGDVGDQSFAEPRNEIERLHRNNSRIYEEGGTAGAAQTGEEYRQALRKAMETNECEILNLPWKAGSGFIKGDREGHFFCARIGDRVYLRFVASQKNTGPGPRVIREIATCLRIIECAPDTERSISSELKHRAYEAWESARIDIYESWMHETDPANLQPRVPKINRELAEFLRETSYQGVPQKRLERCLDALEAPCSIREQRILRETSAAEYSSDGAKVLAVVETVENIGLEPFLAPAPLPPISPDDVHLIAWMAVSPDTVIV